MNELRHAALQALRQTSVESRLAAVQALGNGPLPCSVDAVIVDPGDVPGRPARPQLVAPAQIAGAANRYSGRACGAAACAGAHRVQRNRPGAGPRVALCRPAGSLLPRLDRGGRSRRLHTSVCCTSVCAIPVRTTAISRRTTACGTWRARRRATLWRGWHWYHVHWRLVALDASPAVRAKFVAAGDQASAQVIDLILRDEVGHVAIGNRWFRWLCAQQAPIRRRLSRTGTALRRPAPAWAVQPRGPRTAGFTAEEIDEFLQFYQ